MISHASDLVRLATSTRLDAQLGLKNHDAANAILQGYRDGLDRPCSTLLDESQLWMRDYGACSDDQRATFCGKIDKKTGTLPRRS